MYGTIGSGLSILMLGLAMGRSAHADPGPGFSVSHYKATASAHTSITGVSDANTTPNAKAQALDMLSPFNSAEGDARDLFVHGNALACCGGAGEAGGGGDSTVLYAITGGSPNAVYNLTFNFYEQTDIGSAPGGTQTIVTFYQFNVGSAAQSITVQPETEISWTGATPTVSTKGFKSFSFDQLASGGYRFTGDATVTVQVKGFLLVDDELTIDDSTSGGPVHADAIAEVGRVSIAPDFPGPLPTFTVPGVPNLPASTAVPEPSSWALAILGFGFCGYALRRSARAQATR